MSSEQRIADQFRSSIQVKERALTELGEPISAAAAICIQALKRGNKILACGNGGSAADAQHFASELLNRFEMERPPLPAVALTTDSSTITSIGNDDSFEMIFGKQVQALGAGGDVLLAFSTSGNSANIVEAVAQAHAKGIQVIAPSGKDGGQLARQLMEGDQELRVPSQVTARIQEVHLVITHCLCDLIDQSLYGNG